MTQLTPVTTAGSGARGVSGRKDGRLLLRAAAHSLYVAARSAHRVSVQHTPVDLDRTTTEGDYRAWRQSELDGQLNDHFDVSWIADKDVLDFGCGTGELATLLMRYRPKSVIGVDKSGKAIARASAAADDTGVCDAARPCFVCNKQHDRIPAEAGSVDLICCFDVLEHIPDVGAIVEEWRRVLRPQGRIWIWWSPWRGPYGHHLESLIPLPWVHLLLPQRVIFETCARVYNDPDFVPRLWDRDPMTGEKKPNKWRYTHSFYPFLNGLTRRRWERIVRAAGLTVARHEVHGFSGSRLRRATRAFLPLPALGECFVSYYIYELAGLGGPCRSTKGRAPHA